MEDPSLPQLFVTHGNRLANQVWAPRIPAAEKIGPEASDESRSKFIQDKYSKGRYRRVHALASSAEAMQQVRGPVPAPPPAPANISNQVRVCNSSVVF